MECRVGCGVKCGARCRARCRVRCGAKRGVEGGVKDNAVRGEVGWEEAKMACEITSDAILPI